MMERIILIEENFSQLKELVKKNKDKEIVFSSSDDELNRKVMEKLDISGVLIPLSGRKDYMKQRNSGFNQVMARVASKKEIFIGIDLDELINSKEKERILSRLKQNIFLCKKYKIKMRIISSAEKDIYSLKSLGLSLGMPPWMVKDLS